MRPRLLDLYCGQGGAAAGYSQAGYEVVGVDTNPAVARRFPFRFVRADALTFLREHGKNFDAIHASPPCEAYSIATPDPAKHPRLIEPTREELDALGKPYIIENVTRAPLINPTMLCGSMFDLTTEDVDGTPLRLERHRIFESNVHIEAPTGCRHDLTVQVAGIYGGGAQRRTRTTGTRRGGYTPATHVRAALLGTEWMSQRGLSKAIPPAYTRWLGQFLINAKETA